MEKDTSKSTILVISIGFLALYIIFSWKWAIIVSFIVGIIGILSSYLSKKIEWIWMKFARLIGYIIPNILLGFVYYFILYPISLLSKFFNKDTLMLSRKYPTYFISIDKEFDKNNLKKIW